MSPLSRESTTGPSSSWDRKCAPPTCDQSTNRLANKHRACPVKLTDFFPALGPQALKYRGGHRQERNEVKQSVRAFCDGHHHRRQRHGFDSILVQERGQADALPWLGRRHGQPIADGGLLQRRRRHRAPKGNERSPRSNTTLHGTGYGSARQRAGSEHLGGGEWQSARLIATHSTNKVVDNERKICPIRNAPSTPGDSPSKPRKGMRISRMRP